LCIKTIIVFKMITGHVTCALFFPQDPSITETHTPEVGMAVKCTLTLVGGAIFL